jgi:hypothetical protein
LGNLSINLGKSLAINALDRGDTRASMYQSIGQLPMNLMGAYGNMQTGNALQGMNRP